MYFAGIAIAMAAALGISAVGFSRECPRSFMAFFSNTTQSALSRSPVGEPAAHVPSCVTALGRLEPSSEIVRVQAPAFARTERVQYICAKAGQRLRKGQVIAELESRVRLETALQEAQQRRSVCEAQLKRVLAGAKVGEINAQSATIARMKEELSGRITQMDSIQARLTAELKLAQAELNRYQSLYSQGAISEADLDLKRTAADTAKARMAEAVAEKTRITETTESAIKEAEATLIKIKEVRPVDVEVARAELLAAEAAIGRIETDLAMSTVRSPVEGQVLKVLVRSGEAPGENGIVEMGATASMRAVAEVFESDIKHIRIGEHAEVTGPAFDGVLDGTVSELGWKVTRQNTFSSEPGANFDSRVIEVKIALSPQSSKRVCGLTNLQVQVRIDTGSSMAKNAAAQVTERKAHLWPDLCQDRRNLNRLRTNSSKSNHESFSAIFAQSGGII